tara:strand:- start:50 stop:298 length:249 start_codon:yes stop_codon:yes gene_type:complete
MGRGITMATNNQANDRYNPPGSLSVDFEEFEFGELEDNELFWQTNRPEESNPWRKVSQTQGMNLKTQTTHNFQPKTKVFQKI